MKATVTQYATALLGAVEDAKDEDIDKIVGNFADILRKDGMLSHRDAILERFSSLWDKKKGIVDVRVSGARDIDESVVESVERYFMRRHEVREVRLHRSVEEGLIGGVRIEADGEVVDATVSQRLNRLRSLLSG